MTQIIAEFCQNHKGDMEILARMIEAAAASGATHGKVQNIRVETLTFRPQFEEGLVLNGVVRAIKRPYAVEYERLRHLEMNLEESRRFVELCQENGLIPMSTCFVRADIKALAECGFKSLKVASYDCASFQMLREIIPVFDEIIVSTGATFDDEIRTAAAILHGRRFSLLHCVTLYPTPLDQTHLSRLAWLRSFTQNVGFSDHSLVERDGLLASKAALALGAEVIERHFTILDRSETRDGPVSIYPEQLAELVKFSSMPLAERIAQLNREYPNWSECLGESSRKLSNAELLNRDYYRGRFASPRRESENGTRMIYNWEETPVG